MTDNNNGLDNPNQPNKKDNNNARFVTGSTMRHVVVMTLTNSIGLMALFLVDLIDLYFLNLLGEQEMAASVGFAAQLSFYITGISIGLLIACGILVSQRIGAQKKQEAKQVGTSSLALACSIIFVLSMLLLWQVQPLLELLGAKGRTLELATTYLTILLPSSVFIVMGMVASSILRAMGDAKRSMNTTLTGAFVNLILDPILIFGLDMGIAGAAWASFLARVCMACYAMYCLITIYKMLTIPSLKDIKRDSGAIAKIAAPSMMTNLATPIGSTFVMTAIAKYGDSAVAAYATIGRIIPVAFSVLFALSGAISPIIGQNYGAKEYGRIKETYKNAIGFAIVVVIAVTVLIFAGKSYLVSAFNLSGEASELLMLFCSGLTLFFIADGILFSTNSAFNSLGYPLYSTMFNYAKFFLGVIPCVYVLAHFYGAKGVIIGQSIGPILVTLVAVMVCQRVINNIDNNKPPKPPRKFFSKPMWASSSSKTQV